MPHALIAIPDVHETVLRRIAVDLMTDLAKQVRLPAGTELLLPGASETVPMNKGDFKECVDSGLRYPNDGRLVVRFHEELDETQTLATAVGRREYPPLFYDDGRQIEIRPIYRLTQLVMTVEFVARNRVEAQRWVDEMRSRISMYRAELYHDLTYHYALPDRVHYLLMELHKLATQQAPIDQTQFLDYFNQYKFHPTTVVETLAGTAPRVVYKEKVLNALGWFDFTSSPSTPEKDGDTGTYRTEFSYTLTFNRPMQVYCRWPLLVHNQLIPKPLRTRSPYQTHYEENRKVSNTKGALDAVSTMFDFNGLPYIQLPLEDDWTPPSKEIGYLMFFQGLTLVDPDDPTTVLDLTDVGDYRLNPAVVEYMQHQGGNLFNDGCVYRIYLYENDDLAPYTLTLDGTTIVADRPLDITKSYRVRIGLRRNWQTLPPSVTTCMRRYPRLTHMSLQALGVSLGQTPFEDVPRRGQGQGRVYGDSECPGAGAPPSQGGNEHPPEEDPDNPDDPDDPTDPDDPDNPDIPIEDRPGDGYEDGVIGRGDMEDAVGETDDRDQNWFTDVTIGPMTVLQAGIITRKATT